MIWPTSHARRAHTRVGHNAALISPVTLLWPSKITTKKQVPPYGQRQNYVPRAPEDYGDGGAFPEVHVAQYPLNMGESSR